MQLFNRRGAEKGFMSSNDAGLDHGLRRFGVSGYRQQRCAPGALYRGVLSESEPPLRLCGNTKLFWLLGIGSGVEVDDC